MKRLIEDLFSDKNVVVITGLGISNDSGLPDFRGNDDIYVDSEGADEKAEKAKVYEKKSSKQLLFYVLIVLFTFLCYNVSSKTFTMGRNVIN